MDKKLHERYMRAVHAIQSGIAASPNTKMLEPKHLRVGIDTAKAEQAGLVKLLIAKGISTLEEYHLAIVEALEDEVEFQEKSLQKELNCAKVSLL